MILAELALTLKDAKTWSVELRDRVVKGKDPKRQWVLDNVSCRVRLGLEAWCEQRLDGADALPVDCVQLGQVRSDRAASRRRWLTAKQGLERCSHRCRAREVVSPRRFRRDDLETKS